jgi:hypothetical protein
MMVMIIKIKINQQVMKKLKVKNIINKVLRIEKKKTVANNSFDITWLNVYKFNKSQKTTMLFYNFE